MLKSFTDVLIVSIKRFMSVQMVCIVIQDNLTPLHCAARSGHEQAVEVLVNRGASLFSKTKNGLTPLHMAIQGDHVECAKKLLDHKADIEDVTMVRDAILRSVDSFQKQAIALHADVLNKRPVIF